MYSLNTVTAAITQLADSLVNERNIGNTDTDALALVSDEAEKLIKDQLVRYGMTINAAEELASDAAMRTASPTDDSRNLLNDALSNRGNPLPAAPPANDTNDSAVAQDNQPETATDSTGNNATNDPATAAQAQAPAPAATAAPAATIPASSRPLAGQDIIPKRSFTVEKRSVFDIFTSIPRSETVFDFELQYINWAEKHPSVPKVDTAYNMDGTSLLSMLYAVKNRKTVAIVGPHGAGKTKLVEQIAARLNMPLTIIPMDGQMIRGHLLGQEKIRSTPTGPESYFSYGLLPRALMEPGIILFDEIDRADEGIQYACHSVYEQNFLALMENMGEIIPIHPLNRICATANTKGRGSLDGMYGVGNEMSEATRDRWSVWIEQDYQDEEADVVVLTAKTPGIQAETAKTIANLAKDIRNAYKSGNLSQTCSMRQQLETAEMAVDLARGLTGTPDQIQEGRNKALKMAVERVIMGRATEEDKGAIRTMVDAIAPDVFTAADII